MIFDILMPWWVWLYLGFVLVMFVMSFFIEKKFDRDDAIGSALSLFTICISAIGFFNPQVLSFFGFLLLPMVVIGIVWEFKRAVVETENAKRELEGETELSVGERDIMLNVAIGFNALIVVPGYMMGLVLCFHVIKGLFGA